MKTLEYKQLHCIVCPLGCYGKISLCGSQITEMSGFGCPRGEKYAQEELTAPRRTLTTTVRIEKGELPLLPVISQAPLPKEQILACARYLSNHSVIAPIREGEIIAENILDLGISMLAARSIDALDSVR